MRKDGEKDEKEKVERVPSPSILKGGKVEGRGAGGQVA